MVVNLSDDEPKPKSQPGKQTIIEVYISCIMVPFAFTILQRMAKKKKEKQKELGIIDLVNDIRWMGGLALPVFWAVFNLRLFIR